MSNFLENNKGQAYLVNIPEIQPREHPLEILLLILSLWIGKSAISITKQSLE